MQSLVLAVLTPRAVFFAWRGITLGIGGKEDPVRPLPKLPVASPQ
jgi:hypothetical protein